MKHGPDQHHRLAWGAIAVVMVLLSAISVSVPSAFAQSDDADTQEMRHYFQTIESAYQFILQNYVDKVD